MQNSIRAGLFLIATLCYGETHAQTPPQLTATYHSDAMNLDFTYPSSFAKQGVDESSKNCVSTPIAGMDMSKGFNMIFLRRYDGACIGREMIADRHRYAVNFVNELLKTLGKPDVSLYSTRCGEIERSQTRGHGCLWRWQLCSCR